VKNNLNTPCRKDVEEVLDHLPQGLVDDEYSFSLTRALWNFIGYKEDDDDKTSYNPYTSDEFRLALTSVIDGGRKIDAINKYGIPKQTLYQKLNDLHDKFNVEHGKNGALDMQQLCINESANVNKEILNVLQHSSGFSSIIDKDEADLINRLCYLSGRTGILCLFRFLFVSFFISIFLLLY
jgi:hypothetical protein